VLHRGSPYSKSLIAKRGRLFDSDVQNPNCSAACAAHDEGAVMDQLRPIKASAAVKSLSLFVLACTAGALGAGAQELHADSLGQPAVGAPGYTPTLYVFQNNKLVDVKTFKIADLEECQRRASALLQLYLHHSDIEDDMSLVVKCVPVPPASVAHRKSEQSV
jgi:hypothetical protein